MLKAMNRKSSLPETLQGGCTATGSTARGKAGEFAWEQQAEIRVGLNGSRRYRRRVSPPFLFKRWAN